MVKDINNIIVKKHKSKSNPNFNKFRKNKINNTNNDLKNNDKNDDIVNLKNNNDNDILYLDLSLYVCECGGSFKRFGRRSLNQYVCIDCGLYVPYEKMYLYKKK